MNTAAEFGDNKRYYAANAWIAEKPSDTEKRLLGLLDKHYPDLEDLEDVVEQAFKSGTLSCGITSARRPPFA